MRILFHVCIYFLLIHKVHSQESKLKALDHNDFLIWKTIQNVQLSANGAITSYRLVPGEGDPLLNIYNHDSHSTFVVERASKSNMDYDGKFIYGLVAPHRDSLRHLERKKIEKSKWPGDTLFIYNVLSNQRVNIPNVKEYKAPGKLGDWIAYTVKKEEIKPDTLKEIKPDTTKEIKSDTKKEKEKSKKDILHLVIRQLSTGIEDTLENVIDFNWSEKAPVLMAITKSVDSTQVAGIYYWKNSEWKIIKRQKGEYSKLTLSEDGSHLSFLGNLDTTKAQVPPWQLFYFDFNQDSAIVIADRDQSKMPLVSQHSEMRWSENGRYLYYGRTVMPQIKDTTLLEDEIVDVEIWGTNDPVLYTVQNINQDKEQKRDYTYVFDTQSNKHIAINNLIWRTSAFNPERNNRFVIVYTDQPYQKEITWLGEAAKDLAIADLQTGEITPFKKGIYTQPRLSPGGKFAYGYSEADSTWWTYQIATGVFTYMNTKGLPLFHNELHDSPGLPNAYGSAGWTQDDQSFILYDRYDVWSWSPLKTKAPVVLTHGRNSKTIYRYIRTDDEERFLSPDSSWLIHVTDEVSKSSGYTWFSPGTQVIDSVQLTPYKFTQQVKRARENDVYLFQKESFSMFPDLRITTDRFSTDEKISDANPQKKNYLWGSIELYHWMDWDSVELTGLLVKPPGFDSTHTYPTIVNFYERYTDELHNHWTPAPHRSTINYAFYASRGYVIFNPDVSYEIGLPGESAYRSVVSGTESLIKKQIADPDNIALQGHSWGGYQIAYILTRTNIFKCAEAGASVVNMTSAYGGIRWGTGLSRMFQYEKEQSRLGVTLWQDQQRYLSNSPLFRIDSINTPLLILHNDEDDAVPFEQGIEFYMALRRLGKKAWLLNYRGEPHWPVKWENKKDFNVRMSQFFDHYLKGAPMPRWMENGIPALERGINKGY